MKRVSHSDAFAGLIRAPADFLLTADHAAKVAYVATHANDAAPGGVALIPDAIPRDAWADAVPAEMRALQDRVRIELDDKAPDYSPRPYDIDTSATHPAFNRYALPVSQVRYLQCPVFEALFHGSRGTGKTDTLILDFFQDVGQGWGEHLKGLILRRTYKALEDAIKKSKKLFRKLCPKAKFNGSDYKWTFPDGEELLFGYLEHPSDYERYHGHEYTFIGFEELSLWANLNQYEELKTCIRSPKASEGIPLKLRATSNPSGPGHSVVKKYFIDVCAPGEVYTDAQTGLERTHIYSSILENVLILNSYLPTLRGITEPHRRRAWLLGDWDVTAGGAMDDLWTRSVHVMQPFKIPANWYVDRSYDHGESSPGSVLWWAESNGEEVVLADGSKRSFARGTLFLIAEWYIAKKDSHEGLRLSPREVAQGIKERQQQGVLGHLSVRPGPADNAIFNTGEGGSESIAGKMEREGVRWEKSDKSKGSRKQGLSLFRQRLKASLEGAKDEPGVFVFSNCSNWISNVPVLGRGEKDYDDIDDTMPDHDWDATRYRALAVKRTASVRQMVTY